MLCILLYRSSKYLRVFVASSMTWDTDQHLPNHTATHRRRPLASHTPASKLQVLVSIKTSLERDYFHKLPVILNGNLQGEPHKLYASIISVTSSYYVSRRILVPPSVCRNTLFHTHMNWHTILTCRIRLYKLVFVTDEFCLILKLILIYDIWSYVKISNVHTLV
jgi:hypothetical protein